ncbi:alkaline phosphatase family protein, partial [candidate division KSB1 bacterium]|nr:alkaline phosphatase family protein [candidate division KSB1 bacterium]
MAVKKTRWSILILEDHPDLRETLRSNFADLCGAALRVEFAASICHAIDKIKKQMRRGDPFDIFWIDLYLDYFSYEDELGEIVTVDSFSQIIDTDAFLQRYSLPTASLSELIQKLEIPLDHVDKSWRAFTPVEKLRVLEKFLPFSIPIARSTYATFLETCEFHLRGEDAMSAELNEANLYARYALDFVFRLFLYWLSSPRQREFSPFEDAALAGSEMLNVPILPERQNKSDQSWTIFHTWVQQFYDAVAMGVSGFEEYTAVNLLLQEIKRLSFYGYPQFLVNTAYQRRRQELVSSTTVGTSQNVIVASNNFKGEKKDREFVEHLFRICRRLRRPYLALKRHRRGAGAYLLPPSELNHEATTLSRDKLHEDLLTDNELGIAFSRRAFYPELTASFDKAAADARAAGPGNRTFMLFIDSLPLGATRNVALMPELGRFKRQARWMASSGATDQVTNPALLAAFVGADRFRIFGFVENFVQGRDATGSIVDDWRRAGRKILVYSDDAFLQFGKNGVDYRRYEEPKATAELEPKQHALFTRALEEYRSGAFDIVIFHATFVDTVAHRVRHDGSEYRSTLATADRWIGEAGKAVAPGETLIVFGDHGHNDRGVHAAGLDVPTFIGVRGPGFLRGREEETHPITVLRYLASWATGVPLAAEYEGPRLPHALQSPGPLPDEF